MWYHISLTHKKWLLVCQCRNEIWNHLYHKKLGYTRVFSDGWKVSINQEQWSLPRDLPLCWAWSESTFFSGAPWNFVCLVCTLVIYCFTFFSGAALCLCESLPKFASYLWPLFFPSPITVAVLDSQQTQTNACILYNTSAITHLPFN